MTPQSKRASQAIPPTRSGQQGVALWTVVVLGLLLGLLALSQSSSVLNQFRGSRNERDQALARQAAEAALRDAEADITCKLWVAGALTDAKKLPDNNLNSYCLRVGIDPGGCANKLAVQKDERGMRLLGEFPPDPLPTVDWQKSAAECQDGSCALPFGTKTGAQALDPLLFSAPPRYHVDVFNARLGASEDLVPVFRITARGFGATPTTVVDLQEVYRPC
ncbi:MAG: hypothetical protein C4K60_08875 [Ideonella sp. MAG2]|nr:MAG: hypothetical protein C4K60_08875 [Ideonella sp. MAG2]